MPILFPPPARRPHRRTKRAAFHALALCLAGPLSHAAAPSAPALADGVDLRCPATLTHTPVAAAVPSGWQLRGVPGELSLQRAAFYDGDPVGLGALVPDTTHRVGSTETSTWVFGGDSTRVWIGCLYRDATSVVARQLPAGLRQCTTRTRLSALGDPTGLLAVECR